MVPTQGRENLGEKLLPPESESQFYLDQSLWSHKNLLTGQSGFNAVSWNQQVEAM